MCGILHPIVRNGIPRYCCWIQNYYSVSFFVSVYGNDNDLYPRGVMCTYRKGNTLNHIAHNKIYTVSPSIYVYVQWYTKQLTDHIDGKLSLGNLSVFIKQIYSHIKDRDWDRFRCWFLYRHATTMKNEETFLQGFLLILKRMLQNY